MKVKRIWKKFGSTRSTPKSELNYFKSVQRPYTNVNKSQKGISSDFLFSFILKKKVQFHTQLLLVCQGYLRFNTIVHKPENDTPRPTQCQRKRVTVTRLSVSADNSDNGRGQVRTAVNVTLPRST